jgi:hypothetical protein
MFRDVSLMLCSFLPASVDSMDFSCPRRWIRWISLAEFSYNTSEHSAFGKSPFEVLYGCSPRHFGITDESVSPVPDVASMLEERSTMFAAVRQHLLRAQQRMKA